MSSDHLIIVARNSTNGKIRLPLGDLTLYGTGGEEKLLEGLRSKYDENWDLTIYQKKSQSVIGSKKKAQR